MASVSRRKVAAALIARVTDYMDPQLCCQQAYYAPGLHPVIHVPNYMDRHGATHLPTPKGWMAELSMLADR